MQSILKHEFFPNPSSQYWKYDSSQFVWHLPRIFLSKECVHTVPLGFTMVSNHTYLKMRVSSECLLHVCHPEIAVPNSFLLMDVFLCINGLRSRMLWWRIAAAAVAAAAFEEAKNFPLCGGNGFPIPARRFDLRFKIIRILWTILVIFHGRLGRFEAQIIEVLFLLAQFLNRNSPSTNCQNSYKTFRYIQWWCLHWVIIFEFFLQSYWSESKDIFTFCWSFSWPLWQWNDASATAHELLDYGFFCARIMNNKKLYLRTVQIHRAQNYFSR